MKSKSATRWMLLGLLLLPPVTWGAEGEVVEKRSQEQAVLEGVTAVTAEIKSADDEEGGEYIAKEEPVTQEDLKGIRSEIETLRDQWQRTLDKKTALTTRSLLFGGIVQTRFGHFFNDSNADSFSINTIILSFKGNLKKDYEEGKNVNYAFSLATGSDFSIKPLDAWLSYSILPSLELDKPYLSVTAGQQKKPFSLESLATEEYKPTIKGAQFATLLKLDERDIGIGVKGDLFPHVDYGFKYRVPAIEYSLAVINGTGPNTLDNNDDKDIVGRLVLNAPVDYNNFFRGLSLGGSYYWGKAKSTLTANGTTISRNHDYKTRWGVDLAYVNTPVGFTLEYVRAKDPSLKGTVANPSFRYVESEGYTFTLFYNFGEQFVKGFKGQDRYDDWYPLTYQPFVRFDSFDQDKDSTGDRIDIYTIGFNWFFAETTKLQINYNLKDEQGHEVKNNEFLVQFQYGF